MVDNKVDEKEKGMTKKQYEEINRLLIGKESVSKDAKIFYDGKQYNVRIPAKIAQEVNVDPKKDKIRFTLERPPNVLMESPRLIIELIRG